MREHAQDIHVTESNSNPPGPFEGGLFIDLKDQMSRLFSDISMTDEAGRKTKMLVKYPEFRIALVTMRAGSRWDDHKTPARISVQVLRGHIQFRVAGAKFDLAAGQLITLHPGVVHSVDSVEDSAFLLTLSDPVSR